MGRQRDSDGPEEEAEILQAEAGSGAEKSLGAETEPGHLGAAQPRKRSQPEPGMPAAGEVGASEFPLFPSAPHHNG